MSVNFDRWFRRLWFLNGILLLAIIIFVAVSFAYGVINQASWQRGDSPVQLAPSRAGTPRERRAVRYSLPQEIFGTETRLVRVHYGEGYLPEAMDVSLLQGWSDPILPLPSGSYAARPQGSLVNVVFVRPDVRQARLLLDQPAYIRRIYYPDREGDSLQTWITYEIALDDTNDDGELAADDAFGLYISDLEGNGFRRILPDTFRLLYHGPVSNGQQIVMLCLTPPSDSAEVSDEQMVQRAFLYTLSTGALESFDELDAAIDMASRVVGR